MHQCVGTGSTQPLMGIQPSDTCPQVALTPHTIPHSQEEMCPGPELPTWLPAKPRLSLPPENLGVAKNSQIFSFSVITNYSSTSSQIAVLARRHN